MNLLDEVTKIGGNMSMFSPYMRVFDETRYLADLCEGIRSEVNNERIVYTYWLGKRVEYDKVKKAICDYWKRLTSVFDSKDGIRKLFCINITQDERSEIIKWDFNTDDFVVIGKRMSAVQIEKPSDRKKQVFEGKDLPFQGSMVSCHIDNDTWKVMYDFRDSDTSATDAACTLSVWADYLRRHETDGKIVIAIMTSFDTITYEWNRDITEFQIMNRDIDSAFPNLPAEVKKTDQRVISVNVDPNRTHAQRTWETLQPEHVVSRLIDSMLKPDGNRIEDMNNVILDFSSLVAFTVRRDITVYERMCLDVCEEYMASYAKERYGYSDVKCVMIDCMNKTPRILKNTDIVTIEFTFYF